MSSVKKSIITAMCVALCIVLPMAFHAIPNAGSVYTPMHIPVLICGLVCGWAYGLACGVLGPVLSWLLTGMPALTSLPQMIAELAVYGVVSGLLMKFVRTGRLYADLYVSLVAAMLAGRVVAAVLSALIFVRGEASIAFYATTYFVAAFPGIVIQLALIPTIVVALEKANLIPARYVLEDDGQRWSPGGEWRRDSDGERSEEPDGERRWGPDDE